MPGKLVIFVTGHHVRRTRHGDVAGMRHELQELADRGFRNDVAGRTADEQGRHADAGRRFEQVGLMAGTVGRDRFERQQSRQANSCKPTVLFARILVRLLLNRGRGVDSSMDSRSGR